MIYDIFISYRREGGGATAGRINDMLTNDGYSVSYDVDTLREGRFDDQLLARIEQCQDFVLVVDKDCFKRTVDPATDPKEDWLWQELSYALRLKKNVIPVLLAGADFPKRLPEDIESVRKHNGPKCVHEYFDSFYEKLKDMLHAFPRMAKQPYGQSGTPAVHLPNLKLKADLDCVFYLDGEERSHLKAGIIQKFPLAPGEYELMFVGVENESDRVEMELEMPEADKLQKVYLKDVRDSRLKKEAEARKAAEEKRVAEEKRRAEEQRQAELRRQEAERKAAEERKREEERKRREEEARAKERVFKVGNVEFKMIRVEGGTFQMGSTDGRSDEQPVHSVTLSDYFIGETEVTQALWEAVMGNNPSRFKGADLPVECVSWDDCQDFIRELNRQTGQNFRLPTEAEWEFAARGGNRSTGAKYAGSHAISTVAWYAHNSGSRTHPVKGKSPNELGLYDMSGNVWEWCEDWYGSSYYSSSPQTNPKGPASGYYRVCRGGCCYYDARFCRVAIRGRSTPTDRYHGLRLAL